VVNENQCISGSIKTKQPTFVTGAAIIDRRGGRSKEAPLEMFSEGNRLHRQIAQNICRTVLDECMAAGARLNVLQLSKTLGLSRTPVAAALELMASQGLAVKVGAAGYRLTSWTEAQRSLVSAVVDQDDVSLDVRIAEDRLSGALPDELTEAFLQRRYGIDRISLLKTLKELEIDGLCQSKPGRGWTFEPSLDSAGIYRESYSFRKLIFSRCFFEPTYRFDAVAADRSRVRHVELMTKERSTPREIAQSNAEFYEALAAMSGNRFIVQAARSQNRIRRFRDYAYSWNKEFINAVCGAHVRILDLLAANDIEAASHAIWLYLDEAEKRGSPPERTAPRAD
jgi:DNA-binding GntR family transcriptional regulator